MTSEVRDRALARQARSGKHNVVQLYEKKVPRAPSGPGSVPYAIWR